MKLAVIGGAGYVGLITAVGFAQMGNDVVAVDVNQSVVDVLASGASIKRLPKLSQRTESDSPPTSWTA